MGCAMTERHTPIYSMAELEQAKAEMRARCAAQVATLMRRYKGAGTVRSAILAMPIMSDGSELDQTEREELARILGIHGVTL